MALIAAVVLGALAGAVVESGKRGVITGRGATDQLPPVAKLVLIAILIAVPAVNAGTWGDYGLALLATVGAFTVARWSVASLIVLWRWRG